MSLTSVWIARVSSVFSRSSRVSVAKSWSAFARWNSAWRFWPIMTNVDRKIASSETIRVSLGHGSDSTSSIQHANAAAWRYTNGIEPANPVMASATRSWASAGSPSGVLHDDGMVWVRRRNGGVPRASPCCVWLSRLASTSCLHSLCRHDEGRRRRGADDAGRGGAEHQVWEPVAEMAGDGDRGRSDGRRGSPACRPRR